MRRGRGLPILGYLAGGSTLLLASVVVGLLGYQRVGESLQAAAVFFAAAAAVALVGVGFVVIGVIAKGVQVGIRSL